MDFKPTEEQELMVQAIEEAMTRENLETYFQDCDREHKHPKKWWDLLDELGLFSMFLPEEAGGDGEGAITMFLVMEALGRCGGPIYLFWDHVKADALLENGTKEQIDKFMPMFFEGKPAFAQGFSEPNAGTDLSPATISTTYTRRNGKVYNPMGRVWSEEELCRMGDICLKHNVLVVSDEIHFDIIMPGHKHVSYPTLGEKYANNCVMCCAASKTFSLAGLCVANAIIPNPELRDKLNNEVNISGCYTYSIFGLRALEAGYMKCAEWVDQLNEHIWGNYLYFKEFMAKHFPEVWVADLEGTYLCWFDCRCFGMDGETLAKFLQEKAQLFLDDGYIFGTAGDGFERINLACTRKVLEEALLRFKAAMDQR